jgi:tetratricopeptide (TPR) repeat protein/transcriptional regulator with XRE-family HTH domain
MTDDVAGFGAQLRACRYAAGLSQEALAERSGLSVRAISDLERGRTRRPHPDSVRRLADALALSGQARAEFFIALADGATDVPGLQTSLPRRDAAGGQPRQLDDGGSNGPPPGPADSEESQARHARAVVPRQLPSPVRLFVGRDVELAALTGLLEEAASTSPAVVISAIAGMAGVGKTALAVRWAHQVADRFPDGQLYVNLRGYDQDQPVAAADALAGFLRALGVAGQEIPDETEDRARLYRSRLAGRRVLVVLDNARNGNQVRPLLPGDPSCAAVLTSRDSLAGLVAADGARRLDLDVLPLAHAVGLLRSLIGPRAEADPEAAEELASLCARLPLALRIAAELAVARRAVPLAELAAELTADRLSCLDAGEDRADVRAVFSWSARQLSSPTAHMFRLLGAHPGPDITAPAASSLAGFPPARTRQALAELTRAHLITEHAPGRYTLHDLLRTYAAEQARSPDRTTDRRAAVLRVLDHYLHTACAASQLLHPYRDPIPLSPLQPQALPEELADRSLALAWLQAERQVLLAAITQAAREGLDTHAWQLPWAIATFLNWQGYWDELASVQQSALGAARRAGDRAGQAEAHRYLAQAQIRLGAYADAAAHLTEVIALSRELGRNNIEARAHIDLARALELQDRYPEALSHAGQSLQLYRAAGHRSGEASALNTLGWCHAHLGAHHQALQDCQQALTLHRELGNRVGEANVLDSLGYIHLHLGHHAEAIACYKQAFEVHGEAGDLRDSAEILIHLGEAHQAAADPSAARVTWQQALAILDDLQHPDASEVRSKLYVLTSAGHG